MDINGSLLDLAKKAEQKLLEGEKQEQRKEMGDLADLPAGHPLRVQFEEAKKRYENTQKEKQSVKPLKKAKKVGQHSTTVNTIDKEKLVKSSREVNEKLLKYLKSTEEMLQYSESIQEEFKDTPFVLNKVKRLHRLLWAVRKGIDDSIIKPHYLR